MFCELLWNAWFIVKCKCFWNICTADVATCGRRRGRGEWQRLLLSRVYSSYGSSLSRCLAPATAAASGDCTGISQGFEAPQGWPSRRGARNARRSKRQIVPNREALINILNCQNLVWIYNLEHNQLESMLWLIKLQAETRRGHGSNPEWGEYMDVCRLSKS